MERPKPPALTLELVAQRLDWLCRQGGTLAFHHAEDDKTYATATIVSDEGEKMSFVACVHNRNGNEDVVLRIMQAIGVLKDGDSELGRVPF